MSLQLRDCLCSMVVPFVSVRMQLQPLFLCCPTTSPSFPLHHLLPFSFSYDFPCFIYAQVAPLCKVLQVQIPTPQLCGSPYHIKRLQDAAVAWGAAHKPSIDSALDRLKKGAKDHPQKDGSSKIPAPSSAPLVRRSSEPDVATAFAAASGASAGNDHSLLKNKPVKPQPPPGSKAQVSALLHGASWKSQGVKCEARAGQSKGTHSCSRTCSTTPACSC